MGGHFPLFFANFGIAVERIGILQSVYQITGGLNAVHRVQEGHEAMKARRQAPVKLANPKDRVSLAIGAICTFHPSRVAKREADHAGDAA